LTQPSLIEHAPSAPPRAVGARAGRRAWADPNVRFWWAAGLVLTMIGLYLLVTRYLDWRRDARLVRLGAQVPATVVEADGMTVVTKKKPGNVAVRLRYAWQGQTHEVTASSVAGRSDQDFLVIGSDIPIRIDPDHPDFWTPRLQPASLAQELIGGLIALPLGLILLARSALLRRRLLSVWRTGDAVPAVIVTAHHTALAPRAWSVECTTADDADNRVFNVFVPPEANIQQSAPLWLLFPQGKGAPVAAAWFA
jgi:hypothetical protein